MDSSKFLLFFFYYSRKLLGYLTFNPSYETEEQFKTAGTRTMDTEMEKICAVSMPFSWKSMVTVPSSVTVTEFANLWMIPMMAGKMM